jgi:hypothetical protein
MSTSFRSVFAVLLIVVALAAAAVAPAHSTGDGGHDFVGTWITWPVAVSGETPQCRRLYVTADGPEARDGVWDAPGWNGLVNGAVRQAASDRPVWRGEWRDGQISGSFALTLREDDRVEGTFAGAGTAAAQRWQGRRDTGDPARLPCRLGR